MRNAATPGPAGPNRALVGWVVAGLWLIQATPGAAQTPRPHIKNLGPSGLREYISDSYGTVGFALVNPADRDIRARVLTFYAGAQEKQYGRDVWAPAHATIKSWFSMGPLAHPPNRNLLELKSLVYDRTGAEEHLIRSPDGQPLHSDLVRYEKRQPISTLVLDGDIDDGSQAPSTPEENGRGDALRELVRVFRDQQGLSAPPSQVKQRFLPPIPEAYDGIDQVVLASNRLVDDAPGRRAMRAWLSRGGLLWVPLDLVREDTVKALLGDVVSLQVVDRISLTSIHFAVASANAFRPEEETREFEQPVPFVQVLTPGLPVYYTVDSWPAAFSADVGRGRVLFTTLGAAGWTRPRLAKEPRSRLKGFPDLAIPLLPFQYLAQEFPLKPERSLIAADDLQTYVKDQISYKVVGRTTVLLVFLCLFVALAGAAVVFTRKGFLEHLGWLAPALALGTAAIFIALGELSRGAVPPTVAAAQIIEMVPGAEMAQATGQLAAYQPSLDQARIGAEAGGQFELDMGGLEGRDHIRVQTDDIRWHWENLELPAGVRLAPFQYSLDSPTQASATLRFGAAGVEGRFDPASFQNLGDALLVTPSRHALPASLGADGTVQVSGENGLQTGQLIAADLLNDRQRTRQGLYEKLLAEPQPRGLANQSILLAWADPLDMHFTLIDKARLTGTALLLMPVRFERTPPGSAVTVPGAFVECRRVDTDGHLLPAVFESPLPSVVRLRFQLPGSVLPLAIEKARFRVHLHAPAREVAIHASGLDTAPLRVLSGPTGMQEIEINDPGALKIDEHGALYLNINIGPVRGRVEKDTWRIEWPDLEVKGKT
jgi:hypothetical protein